MKKIFLLYLFLFLLLFQTTFSNNFKTFKNELLYISSSQNIEKLNSYIKKVELYTKKDSKFYTLSAHAHFFNTEWQDITKNLKLLKYEKALEISFKALKKSTNDDYTYYVIGVIAGRVAEYSTLVEALKTVKIFDKYITKSMDINPENFLSILAMALKYKNAPWPINNYKKSEKLLLKCINTCPDYIFAYYELSDLYIKTRDYNNAKKFLNIAIKTPVNKTRIKEDSQAKENCKILLNQIEAQK